MNKMPSTSITEEEKRDILRVARIYGDVPESAFTKLWPVMRVVRLHAGELLCRVNQQPAQEFLLLEGVVRTSLCDLHGRSVTFDFYQGPCAIAPAITRSKANTSRVDCEALSAAHVVVFGADALSEAMLQNLDLATWGNAVLHRELIKRADKEIALVSQSASERLTAIYQDMPEVYRTVPQHHLASYLGITPVSLSRLRKQLGKS